MAEISDKTSREPLLEPSPETGAGSILDTEDDGTPLQVSEKNQENFETPEELEEKLDKLFLQPPGKKEVKPSRKSSVSRVVGRAPDSVKASLLRKHSRNFRKQASFTPVDIIRALIKEREDGKSPEAKEIISLANDVTNLLLRRHGLESFDIPPENVHIMIPSYLGELRDGVLKLFGKGRKKRLTGNYQGYFRQMQEGIEVDKKKVETKTPNISLLHATVHEMIHGKSYNVNQTDRDANPIDSAIGEDFYRCGLMITTRDRKKQYFQNLNEAVTESETINCIKEILDDPVNSSRFAKELEKIRQAGESLDDYNPYQEQRKILADLILKIRLKNDRSMSSAGVMDIFSKAMMTGNILPLARLIDKSFGKGTFRKIGELDIDTKNTKGLKDFIDSL
jgi:hypothetical protein